MVSEYDVLVFGSGFSASAALLSLREVWPHASYRVIDTSEMFSQIHLPTTLNPIFDPKQIIRTARPGGGIDVWGAGISLPSDTSWFLGDTTGGAWSSLRTEIARSEAKILSDWFGVSKSNLVGKLKKFPFKHQMELKAQRHVRTLFPATKLELPARERCTAGHRLTQLIYDGSKFEVGLLDANGCLSRFQSRRVVLAAGPIVSGILAAHITGTNSFSLGNHVSALLPSLKFDRPRRLSEVGHFPGSLRWQTFEDPNATGPAFSLRLTQGKNGSGIDEILSSRSYIDFRNSSISLASNKLRITSHVGCLGMLDFPASASNTFRLETPSATGSESLRFFIQTKLDGEVSGRYVAHQAESHFRSLLGDYVFEETDFLDDLELGDAAHYYGSIPITSSKSTSSLSTQANGALTGSDGAALVVGSALFGSGGHAHPTALNITASRIISDRYWHSTL